MITRDAAPAENLSNTVVTVSTPAASVSNTTAAESVAPASPGLLEWSAAMNPNQPAAPSLGSLRLDSGSGIFDGEVQSGAEEDDSSEDEGALTFTPADGLAHCQPMSLLVVCYFRMSQAYVCRNRVFPFAEGARIQVLWSHAGSRVPHWYSGTIDVFSSSRGHHVVYEDGDLQVFD